MRVLLVSCYELGHQPLSVASAAARLESAGHEVRGLDLSVQEWDPGLVDWADRLAYSVPMHTAARLARPSIREARAQRPGLPIACFGLYALTMTADADACIAGESDQGLVEWAGGDAPTASVRLGRDARAPGASPPRRDLLPPLDRYTRLIVGDDAHLVGSVAASHGCAHRCRHCPVPVVYDGRTRIVDAEVVLADVDALVEAGAAHVSFADPDFFNAVHHSLRVLREMHARHPALTFDCTVKVEHALAHAHRWDEMAELGCLFVVSAFECVDDATLARLDKGHTAADAAAAVVLLRAHGIAVRPSWMPFTPWTRAEHVEALLDFVADHDLVPNVDPIQYTIRLLIPEGSLLLGHPDLRPHLGDYDTERASYRWQAADPAMDDLQRRLAALVEAQAGEPIPDVYDAVRTAAGLEPLGPSALARIDAPAVPRLSEPWFCCAEPTDAQMGAVTTR